LKYVEPFGTIRHYPDITDMTDEEHAAMVREMYARYADPDDPHSLADVGQKYGYSRERIGQFFRESGLPIRNSRSTSAAKREARKRRDGR
jgi:hypothetical protein